MVEIIFWIAIFSSPLILGLAIAFIIYIKTPELEWLSIGIAGLAVLIGILIAERVRRKYGCTRYMSRLFSTPDIWPTDTYDKKSNEDIYNKKR
jgi:hypothetical protein